MSHKWNVFNAQFNMLKFKEIFRGKAPHDSSVPRYRPRFIQRYAYALVISPQSGCLISKICILYTSLIHMVKIKLTIHIYSKSRLVKWIYWFLN